MNSFNACLLEWPKSRALTTPNAGENMEQWELSFIAGGNAKWYSHFGRHFCGCLQKTLYMLAKISCNCAPWYLVKGEENLCLHKSLCMDVYGSFIHNCPKLKAAKMSFSR